MGVDFAVVTIFKSKDEVSKNFNRMGKNANLFGKKTSKAFGVASKSASSFGAITKGILAAGAVQKGLGLLSSGLSEVTTQFVQFDSAVTSASAKFKGLDLTTKEGQKTLELLKTTARETGATTKFSAAEAAQGLDFYATAGFNAAQAMAVLNPTAKLATVANLDLARTSDIASDSLGAFGLMTEDSTQLQKNFTRISDVMAKTMTSTNTNMEDMFESIKKGAPTFTATGQRIETFNALMGTMANAGIKGSESGTQLRNIMLSLSKPTGEAQDAIEQLGIKTRDSSGNFRDVIDILADFETGLSGMGNAQKAAALKTIFGVRSVTGLNLLLQEGSANLREFRGRLDESSGATDKMATIMETSLENRLLSLKSAAIETGFQLVSAFQEEGGGAIEALTKAIRGINMEPFINALKGGIRFSKMLFNEFTAFGERTGLFDAITTGITALKPHFSTVLDVVKTMFKFFDDIGVFDAMVVAIKIVIATMTTMSELITLLWKNVIKPIIGGITSAVETAKNILGVGGIFGGEEREQRDQSTRDIIEEQRAKNLAERRARRAPNQTQLESRAVIDGNINLNIAGAPEGSTAATNQGRRAPQIKVNMLEFATPQ